MKKINILFFLLLPFIDVITALSTRLVNLPISLGIVIKGLYILVLSIYVLFYSKSKYKKWYLGYVGIVSIFTVLYFITKSDLLVTEYIFTEFTYIFKAFYSSILFFGLLVLYDDNKFNNSTIDKLMIYSLFVYCLLLLIPTLTHTNFDSYGIEKGNEGTIGWFYAGNDISAIMLMLYPFIYTFFDLKVDKKNKKTNLYYLFLFLVVGSIFIIGTKTSWLGFVLITLILAFKKLREKDNNFMVIGILLLLLIPLTFVAPAITNTGKTIEDVKIENSKTVTKTEKKKTTAKKEVIKETTVNICKSKKLSGALSNYNVYRILNITLSGRQNKAYTELLIYGKAPIADKFFGVGFTNTKRINECNVTRYIEMDILDIFIHYGIIGLIVLLMPFGYVIIYMFKNKENFNSKTKEYLAIGIIMFIISLVAGHIIGYPSSGIYYSLYLLLIVIGLKEKDKLV